MELVYINDKENAYLSYHLATIVKDVPVEINLDDNPIIKVYGYFSGYIDVNRSKK